MHSTLRHVVLCGVLLLLATSAGAQSYALRKQVIASGGNRIAATPYVATVTIAEPVASAPLIAGSYRLTGGFQGRRAALSQRVFCDGFEATPCP